MRLLTLAALVRCFSWAMALENCWFWQLPYAEFYLLLWCCHGEWGQAFGGLAVKHFARIIWKWGRWWVCAFDEREFEYRGICLTFLATKMNLRNEKTGGWVGPEKCHLHTEVLDIQGGEEETKRGTSKGLFFWSRILICSITDVIRNYLNKKSHIFVKWKLLSAQSVMTNEKGKTAMYYLFWALEDLATKKGFLFLFYFFCWRKNGLFTWLFTPVNVSQNVYFQKFISI